MTIPFYRLVDDSNFRPAVRLGDHLLTTCRAKYLVQLIDPILSTKTLFLNDYQVSHRMENKRLGEGRIVFTYQPVPNAPIFALFCTKQMYSFLPRFVRLGVMDVVQFHSSVYEEETTDPMIHITLLTKQPTESIVPYAKELFQLCQRVETYQLT